MEELGQRLLAGFGLAARVALGVLRRLGRSRATDVPVARGRDIARPYTAIGAPAFPARLMAGYERELRGVLAHYGARGYRLRIERRAWEGEA